MFATIAQKSLGGRNSKVTAHIDDINNTHPTEAAKSKAKGQMQITRYASANDKLFRYSDANNREELV